MDIYNLYEPSRHLVEGKKTPFMSINVLDPLFMALSPKFMGQHGSNMSRKSGLVANRFLETVVLCEIV